MSWSEFFAMGGYGLYVWGAYGMTVAVLLIEMGVLRHRRRTILARLGRRHRDTVEGQT